MAKSKKTTHVKALIQHANEQLARTDQFATKDLKSGICLMIEHVMHETNNYDGFQFVNNNDCALETVGYYSRKYYIKSQLSF